MDVNIDTEIATSSLLIHVHFYFEDAGEGNRGVKRKSEAVCVGACVCVSASCLSLYFTTGCFFFRTSNKWTDIYTHKKSHPFTQRSTLSQTSLSVLSLMEPQSVSPSTFPHLCRPSGSSVPTW